MRTRWAVILGSCTLFLGACEGCDKKPTGSTPGASGSTTATTAPPPSAGPSATTATSGAAPGAGGSVDKACSAYADAVCAKLKTCDGGAALKGRFGDEAKCKDRAKLECAARLGAPDVTVADKDGAECVKAVGAAACGDLGPDQAPAACRGKGTRKTGAPCTADDQCETLLCNRAGLGGDRGLDTLLGGDGGGADCGKCEAPAKEGEMCLNMMLGTSTPCLRGLTCDVAASPAKCTKTAKKEAAPARAGDGEACKADDGCLEPAACIRGRCKVLDAAACK